MVSEMRTLKGNKNESFTYKLLTLDELFQLVKNTFLGIIVMDSIWFACWHVNPYVMIARKIQGAINART